MRGLVVLSFVLGCAGNQALDKRMSDLETRPPHDPTVDVKFDKLEKRLAESEKAQRKQAGEIEELQKIVHELAEQVADNLANLPMPTPTTTPPPVPSVPGPRASLDPTKVYAITIDDSPVVAGSAASAVTLVAAVQFPEPYTHKSWPVIQQLITDYGKDLRVVVKMFIVHPQSTDSTIAGCAVAMQKKLDKYEDDVYTASMGGGTRRWPDATEARNFAKAAGADLKAFDRDVLRVCTPGKARDIKLLQSMGQGAVPTFWINGRPLSGAQPITAFKQVIDDEKAKAMSDRQNGGKAATYYDRVVVKAGAKTGP